MPKVLKKCKWCGIETYADAVSFHIHEALCKQNPWNKIPKIRDGPIEPGTWLPIWD